MMTPVKAKTGTEKTTSEQFGETKSSMKLLCERMPHLIEKESNWRISTYETK